MKKMCEPSWGQKVEAWPVGIDTERWRPKPEKRQEYDFLIYDKVRWEHEKHETQLIEPIRRELKKRGQSFAEIRYGYYREQEFHSLLTQCRAMVFLCEHETQGIAYQQALSSGVPILAWDRGGVWQDPSYYPHKVKFGPVSSVPYWDVRCGIKFTGKEDFSSRLEEFLDLRIKGEINPRKYILENLTLEKCAEQYLYHLRSLAEAG
jgi:glycosyltransferase involved in cell wall biosynthesis